MSDYTPTAEEVREAYQSSEYGLDFKRRYFERGIEFDRWLASVKADVWDEGAIAYYDPSWTPECPENPYRLDNPDPTD